MERLHLHYRLMLKEMQRNRFNLPCWLFALLVLLCWVDQHLLVKIDWVGGGGYLFIYHQLINPPFLSHSIPALKKLKIKTGVGSHATTAGDDFNSAFPDEQTDSSEDEEDWDGGVDDDDDNNGAAGGGVPSDPTALQTRRSVLAHHSPMSDEERIDQEYIDRTVLRAASSAAVAASAAMTDMTHWFISFDERWIKPLFTRTRRVRWQRMRGGGVTGRTGGGSSSGMHTPPPLTGTLTPSASSEGLYRPVNHRNTSRNYDSNQLQQQKKARISPIQSPDQRLDNNNNTMDAPSSSSSTTGHSAQNLSKRAFGRPLGGATSPLPLLTPPALLPQTSSSSSLSSARAISVTTKSVNQQQQRRSSSNNNSSSSSSLATSLPRSSTVATVTGGASGGGGGGTTILNLLASPARGAAPSTPLEEDEEGYFDAAGQKWQQQK